MRAEKPSFPIFRCNDVSTPALPAKNQSFEHNHSWRKVINKPIKLLIFSFYAVIIVFSYPPYSRNRNIRCLYQKPLNIEQTKNLYLPKCRTNSMKPSSHSGQLIKWKGERAFGFIQPVDGSKEVFLHISELKDATRRPQLGDTTNCYVVAKDGKERAYNAFILRARGKPISPSSINKNTSNAAKTASIFTVLIFQVLLLSVIPLVGSIHLAWKTSNLIPIALYPAMSLVTFALYTDDKACAQTGNWRTSEKTLHLCELAGGWLGGFIAQRKLHYKNRKQSYQIVFWGIVATHHVAWLG